MTNEENNLYDVQVINAFKSYKGNDVIKGLDMNIKSGCIYGLLGPSGCGKSTLLQCILGLIPLDSGRIDLRADNFRDIGYMPQDLCLDNTLTVGESLNYYGSLYNMSKEQINCSIKKLSSFLKLPNLDICIDNISGGQGRRVSLAISLLHDPDFIILDEPTVGIDPLLRHNIWEAFTRMVQEHKKTIIITTHYIEEASQANFVGLMRKGKLVEEGTPGDILLKYNTDTLESAFLSLCFDRETNQVIDNQVSINNVDRVKYNKPQTKNLRKLEKTIDFTRIKALLKKNILVFSRDYFMIFTTIILPILQTVNFGECVGGDMRNISIAVLNDEIDYSNCKYFSIDGCIANNENNETLSCLITDYLISEDYKMVQVYNRNDGDMMLKDSNYAAFIYFPKNYTYEFIKYIDDRDSYILENQAILKNQFLKDVSDSIKHLFEIVSKSCSNNPNSLNSPITFETIIGKELEEQSSSLIPVFMALLGIHYTSTFSLSVMLSERMDGLLSRSMFAGVTVLELLISMFCITTMIIVLHMIIPVWLIYVFFAHPIIINSGIIVYIILVLLIGWIGFFVGLIIAGLVPNKIGGLYLLNGWIACQFLLTGAIWPVEAQPTFVRFLTEILPTRIISKTIGEITLKGWTIANPSVIMGLSITTVYTIGLILFLIILGKFKKDMWVIHK